MPDTLGVFSPVGGVAVPLEQVPDPVFSERMLGDGLAVDPAEDVLLSPMDGKIAVLNPNLHALAVRKDGFEILIHVGLETVALQGKGFKAFVREGDEVKKGQKLLEFDREFIKKNAPSALVIVVLTQPSDVKVNAVSGQVRAGDLLFHMGGSADAPTAAACENALHSNPFLITDPNGLHARPAGLLAQTARTCPFEILMEKNGQTADAKSVVGMMSLAVKHGETVRFIARTADEASARKAFAALEDVLKGAHAPQQPAPPCAATPRAACPGLAKGAAYQLHTDETPFEENAQDPAKESQRLTDALSALEQTLQTEAAASHGDAKEILQAHLDMLADPLIKKTTQDAVARGKTAEFAFNEAVRESISLLKHTRVALLAERQADLKDLRRRLLHLLGHAQQPAQIPPHSIVIARELLPSDTALLHQAAGVLTAEGSPTAHASILLRNLAIPTLVNAGEDVLHIPDGAPVLLDADNGRYTVRPSEEETRAFDQRLACGLARADAARKEAQSPAVTKDGVTVTVGGNVNSAEQAATAQHNGADGLGLVRTEFLFLNHSQPPSFEEQKETYLHMVRAMRGKPVTLRTLDAGGDKPLPFLHIPPEENPIVGKRGVRTYADHPDIFRTQIRAMLAAAQEGPVRIMIPMIGFVEELSRCRRIIKEEQQRMGVTADVQIGMMTEVPSAALMAEQFAREADFFSLGTNDLTQYTLAIDRGHKTLHALADGLHPAVLKLIALTGQGAHAHGKETAVCGALAGDPAAVPLLIGLGVRELAVGVNDIPRIKTLVRTLHAAQCREIAQQALALQNAADVRALVRKEFNL